MRSLEPATGLKPEPLNQVTRCATPARSRLRRDDTRRQHTRALDSHPL